MKMRPANLGFRLTLLMALVCALAASAQPRVASSQPKSVAKASAPATVDSVYTPALTLYSETSYQSLIDDYVNQTKATFALIHQDGWRLYGSLAVDQDSRSDDIDVYNDNHVSGIVGLSKRLSLLPVTFFAEGREALRPGVRPRRRASEEPYFLGGVMGYQYGDLTRVAGSSGRVTGQNPVSPTLFAEGYGEVVENTLVVEGLAAGAWLKSGIRAPFARYLTADLYGEGVFKRSTRDYLAENLQEAGPGARLTARFSQVSASASVRRGFGIYSSAPTGTQNSYSSWTALLVLAGEL